MAMAQIIQNCKNLGRATKVWPSTQTPLQTLRPSKSNFFEVEEELKCYL